MFFFLKILIIQLAHHKTKGGIMKVRCLISTVTVFCIFALTGQLLAAAGFKINACVNNNSGEVRIVEAGAACKTNWSPLTWSVARTQPTVFAVNCGNGETIQGALGSGLIAGDELLVSGTCTENIIIPEEVHRITVNGQGTATINGGSSRTAIEVLGRRITIKGFNIMGGTHGVSVDHGGGAIIDGNKIASSTVQGIEVFNGSTAIIINNEVYAHATNGIVVGNNSSAQIGVYFPEGGVSTDVYAPNAIYSNGNNGIMVTRSSYAAIRKNSIGSNQCGILVKDGSFADITNNSFTGNVTTNYFINPNSNANVKQ